MQKCLIYGAGKTGQKVLQAISSYDSTVAAFIDEYSNQTQIQGIPVLRLSEAKDKTEYLEYPVIVSVFNPKADMREIVEKISESGFENVIDFYAFYKQYGEDIGTLYWLSTSEKMLNAVSTTTVRKLFADQKSIDLFDCILNVRTTYSFDSLPLPDECPQYCPQDIDFPYDVIQFADCGAFTGDSIAAVVSHFSTDSYFCFEPDYENFKGLQIEAAKTALEKSVNFILMPCGVWSKNKVLKFCSDSASGTIATDGDVTIQCVALDNVFFGKTPNYIKMDVEGAELFALQGAEKIIRETKPALAICVYHKPEDLWDIPLYIHKLNPEYKFYLRQYEFNLFDTVLYAI
ncbi:MAG: FkbM family methyltransferase [Deltaproteobacteria bacterium]|nr:FkbM family methyltransferase [Deltaproteobacteria bacterium]